MRRSRAHSPSPYRALAHHPGTAQMPDSLSLLRSFHVETNPTRPMRPSPLTASTIPDMPLDLLDRIRSFPLFVSAPDEFLVAIGRHLRPQIHAAHDVILTEGDVAKAMYWLVRGVVAVTSRDGEAIYAELKAGSFFGEIGVLMDMPRTATIVARTKCLLLVLKKEDVQQELPGFPQMEKAIRQEAHERLTILKKKRQESKMKQKTVTLSSSARDAAPGEVSTGDVGAITGGAVINHKKRKSPSPGVVEDAVVGSALGSGYVNVRQTLKELPLFSTLPPDVLHFLGMNAQPKTYSPFTDIVQQGAAGNDIFFIVRGEAEVVHEDGKPEKRVIRSSYVRPRLRRGQYFGEVSSLGLSRGRTATVRSITTVECLMIPGDVLDELWVKCPPEIRRQVEATARRRIKPSDGDVDMKDVADIGKPDSPPVSPNGAEQGPALFTTPSTIASSFNKDPEQLSPKDPDPYLSVDMENLRNRRRGSLAPPTPPNESIAMVAPATNGLGSQMSMMNMSVKLAIASNSPDSEGRAKKARIVTRRQLQAKEQALLPDDVLVSVFQGLELAELMRLRRVSSHWRKILTTSPRICLHVDLRAYNRKLTDEAVINVVAPFIGPRPEVVDVSNCFHLTDAGFSALWKRCGRKVKTWRMKSVWEVSANQILDMSEHAKGLEEVDWSNCRKVGDNLLARVVGWVVPEPVPQPPKQVVLQQQQQHARVVRGQHHGQHRPPNMLFPPPGTVIGCARLKRLNLSYCKHITDRSMAHLAAHASKRLERLTLTRCTSISDDGFQTWTPYRFTRLTHLCLADCTYLSDNAIIALVTAAKALTHLDLSFCCALSDTATEVVALGLPKLRELRMAFCGSAVSDNSLACIALHLNDLERLSVRGCVRVTAVGVESVLEGCARLRWCDISQCRNTEAWINGAGVERWGYDERVVEQVAGRRTSGPPRSLSYTSSSSRPQPHPQPQPHPHPQQRRAPVDFTSSPRGVFGTRRPPVAFVVEKGPGDLR